MENKLPVVCFGFTTFKGDYAKSTLQLINRLAKDRLVLYIDYQYTLKDFLFGLIGKTKVDYQRLINIKPRLRKETTDQNTSIYVLSLPPVMPINWLKHDDFYKIGLRVNSAIISNAIKGALKKLQLKQYTLINAFNPAYGLYCTKIFKLQQSIYYCYDEISASNWAKNHAAKIEADFMKKVDMVVVTSKALLQAKSTKHTNVHLVRNGVDFNFFNSATQRQSSHKNNDSIGYIGSVDDRLDYELIEYLISSRPDNQFIFIGRITDASLISKIKTYPNVLFTGAVKYKELPKELNRLKVCLIPFLKNAFTAKIYPLKINEYLAMGKAVVKTDFADLPEFDHLTYTGFDKSSFDQSIEKALSEDNATLYEKRTALAKNNSWQNRVNELNRLIDKLY